MPTRTPAAPARLHLDATRGRRNVPWVVFGTLLVAGSALAFATWAIRAGERHPVLAIARQVNAGERIHGADVTEVSIQADGHLRTLPITERHSVIGRRAAVDLRPGTPLSASLLLPAAIRTGQAVVGLSFDPGAIPADALHAGDPVLVVRTPSPQSVSDEVDDSEVLTWPALIQSLEALGDQVGGRVAVSLLVGETNAPAIAVAASADRVRLIGVSPTSVSDLGLVVWFSAAEADS